MEFKRIALSDAPTIRRALCGYTGRFCDISMGNIIFWRDYYDVSFFFDGNSFAVRYGEMDGEVCYYAQMEKELIRGILEREGGSALFTCLTEEEVSFLKENFYADEPFHERDWDDYIYSAEEIISLKGRRFNGQRNHINKFKKLYPDYSFKEIDDTDLPALKAFVADYFSKKRETDPDDSFDYEESHLYEQLDNLAPYAQRTGVLSVDGRIVGFSIGELVGDTLIIHTEKADTSYDGAYATLVNLFAKRHATDAAFINREEDCGIEGLRRSKLSYHPIEIKPKYALRVSSEL